jgi:hypothetical protein
MLLQCESTAVGGACTCGGSLLKALLPSQSAPSQSGFGLVQVRSRCRSCALSQVSSRASVRVHAVWKCRGRECTGWSVSNSVKMSKCAKNRHANRYGQCSREEKRRERERERGGVEDALGGRGEVEGDSIDIGQGVHGGGGGGGGRGSQKTDSPVGPHNPQPPKPVQPPATGQQVSFCSEPEPPHPAPPQSVRGGRETERRKERIMNKGFKSLSSCTPQPCSSTMLLNDKVVLRAGPISGILKRWTSYRCIHLAYFAFLTQ